MTNPIKSVIQYSNQWPKLDPQQSLVIFDKILLKDKAFRKWIKAFPQTYPVQAGESLKALDQFPKHAERLLELLNKMSGRQSTIVAIGGGSVGDFGGFMASVLLRGTKLIHIPTTWLACIDSAHGGKTALNSKLSKNQVGTFYPAERIIIIKKSLDGLTNQQLESAMGEVIKMGLLKGGTLWQKISKIKSPNSKILWKLLPELIDGKMSFVKKDLHETKGIRKHLNLGHTYGHLYEKTLNLAHGDAVLLGLQLSLLLSHEIYKRSEVQEILQTPVMKWAKKRLSLESKTKTLIKVYPASKITEILMSDKKRLGSHIEFVTIKSPGRTQLQKVSSELMTSFLIQIHLASIIV